jgi:hypothetical protein
MPKPSLRDISVPGVVLGATSDIVATNLLLAPVAVLVFSQLGPSLTAAERSAAFSRAFSDDPRLYLVGMVLGCAASVFGGWIAARIAKRAELLNGALSAFACVGFGIYGMATRTDAVPLWQHVAFFVLSPALGAVGGSLRRRQNARATLDASNVATSTAGVSIDLHGLGYALYVGNRVIAGIGVLGFLFFGLIGLYGYSQHQTPVILGSVVFGAIVLVVVALLQMGARLLRAGRRGHWAYHGGALVIASMVAALFVVSLAARHRAG